MNDTAEPTIRIENRPDVTDFVDRVRERLSDLTEEEREELVGGLEADLSELVADQGSSRSVTELVGDPAQYADELRSAAGLAPSRKKVRRPGQPLSEQVASWLDGAQQRWALLVADPRVRPVWEAAVAVRPAWWVLRAWLAVQVLDLATGPWEAPTLIPTLYGAVPGGLVLLAATAASVQGGRRQLWPGSAMSSSVLARVIVLAVNAAALVAIPNVVGDGFPIDGGQSVYRQLGGDNRPGPGLRIGGRHVENVFPYDAEGRPLTGVQLFDQSGKPLTVARRAGDDYGPRGRRTVTYPWLNGSQRLYNVYPLPRRAQTAITGRVLDDAWESGNPPALPQPPLAVVPPAALPTQPAAKAQPADSEKPGSR